jgi:hypothetical protein
MTMSASVVAYADVTGNVDLQDVTKGKTTSKQYASSDISVSASVLAPTISVSVPTENAFLMNPYNLQVTSSEEFSMQDGAELTTDGNYAKILSPEYEIVNDSNVPMIVSVSVSNVVAKGVALRKNRLSTKSRSKEAFIYLDFKLGEDGSYSRLYKANASDPDTFVDGATSTNSVYYSKSASQVLLFVKSNRKPIVKNSVVTIPEAKNGVSGTAYYCFFGDVVSNPKKAWKTTDMVTCSITFTFTPTAVSTAD